MSELLIERDGEVTLSRSTAPRSADPGKPTIAAINGWCLAGGVELASWCDFRFVAENARLGLLNQRWGLSLADGGTQRLPRVVGIGNALSGRPRPDPRP